MYSLDLHTATTDTLHTAFHRLIQEHRPDPGGHLRVTERLQRMKDSILALMPWPPEDPSIDARSAHRTRSCADPEPAGGWHPLDSGRLHSDPPRSNASKMRLRIQLFKLTAKSVHIH